MTSWKIIILALKQHGLREVDIAQQVGCCQSAVNDLLHERLKEPRYPVGVALHALMERQGKARAPKPRKQAEASSSAEGV